MTTAVETDPTASAANTAPEQSVPSWVDAISDPEVLGYIVDAEKPVKYLSTNGLRINYGMTFAL